MRKHNNVNMSRFLTPTRVGLLVLIASYSDSAVPSSSIIPVLSFVTTRTLPRSVTDSEGHVPTTEPHKLALDIDAFKEALQHLDSTVPGRTVYDGFVTRLWAIDSLHALHDFFRNLQSIVVSPDAASADRQGTLADRILLARTSPLGVFVRRAALEFTRLQFDDTVKLWRGLFRFRAPSERAWRHRQSATLAPLSFDSNFAAFETVTAAGSPLVSAVYPDLGSEHDEPQEMSTEQMERLLEFQIEKLQKFGSRLSPDVQESCERLLQQSSAVPSLAHFVKFFDSWRAGDYTTAFESMHRYFDYTMHTQDRSCYQYALLHMAILQADFGCFSEAVAAIKETISTARENQDMNCLNFSLSWLNNLSRTYPRETKAAGHAVGAGSERDGLLHLKAKAKEMRLPNLLSSVLLSEAKWLLASGDSVVQAFERTCQSAHLNAMYGFQNMYGIQSLVFASLYGRLGYNKVAKNYCEVLLDCYRYCSPVDEVLRASCRMAYTAVQSGSYKQADEILDSLQPLVHRNLRSQQYLTMYARVMKLKHALRRHDLETADYLLSQLPYNSPGLAIDPDIKLQIQLLKIDYLQRLENYEAAFDAIEDLAESLKADDADIYQRIHVMILKARLFDHLGKPERGFTIAMRAARAAWHARIMPALWEAWAVLANILGAALGEWDAQRRILECVIPQALGCGDLAQCAQMYEWQADACMSLAGLADEGSIGRSSWVSKAETYLDRASSYYKRIEDVQGECDTIAKKATIARLRGDEDLAQDWARRYLALYDRHVKDVFGSEDDEHEDIPDHQ